MSGRHVGFTGTREGLTDEQRRTLKLALSLYRPWDGNYFHHGGCVGADAQAHDIALRNMAVILHPPTDDRLRAYCDDVSQSRPAKAYLDRNRDIVDESDMLIACPKEETEQAKGGTWYTVRYARDKQVPTFIIWPNGTMEDGS